MVNNFCSKGNDTSSHSTLESSPSRRTFNFRMLVRGKDGEPAGSEDVHCVGYIDQWTRKETQHQNESKTQDQSSTCNFNFNFYYFLFKILIT